ncbi:pheromone A receptor-domain-containing protein [Aspergillus novoparasiticus]|uniref:Pheromone A receptor-domain-containing protein n=4 Tax=Aspergillus novoparasiticus TaxID=986946 RepID=A0A5N6EW72_9EURO|nr:pheromone A receptor-domain-containing protein [Aspergillus novoparasiticus]
MLASRTAPYAQAVIIPSLSILCMLLTIPPLILHWKNRNFPVVSLICWLLCLNLFNIINAFIWPNDDMDNWWNGAGLCDVEVKVMIASYVAVPGNLLCIFRTLARMIDTRRAMLVPSKQQRWWNIGIDMLFCVIVPAVAMATHIVYQASRYILVGISGCVNSFDESWVSLILAWIWPLVICLIAGYHCSLVVYRLHRYRNQFGDILQASNSNLNKSRFMRLFLLSFIVLLAILPVQTYVVYKNIELSLPWHSYSWRVAHGPHWNKIQKIPSGGDPFFDRWFPIASGFMLFILFGCGRDASRMYGSYLRLLRLDRCFVRTHDSSSDACRSNTSGFSNSRFGLLFHKTWTSTAGTGAENPAAANSIDRSSDDIEKGRVSSLKPQRGQNMSWLKHPWSFLHRPPHRLSTSSGERILSHPSLSTPSNTVSANAWAGSSQSRGSSDLTYMPGREAFIRVKRDISQESELRK